ncbi:MAG TPA: hypothetical protein VGT44_06335, partial [Ktedonobacteraceae bacterium]|nr:hypothetical protein [Ktedonobacteraceae bacterium]
SQPALEHEQESVEAIQKSPVISGSSAPIQTALGRPDQGTSLDVTRPQRDAPNLYGQTALGRPDQEASHDVTRP